MLRPNHKKLDYSKRFTDDIGKKINDDFKKNKRFRAMAVSLFHRNLSLIRHINSTIYFMPHWLNFRKFIFNFSITSKKHSFPMFDLNVLMKIT